MDTFSHGFWNFFIFYKSKWRWAVLLGGILPDLIYFVGAPYVLIVQPFPESFNEFPLNILMTPWVRTLDFLLGKGFWGRLLCCL